MNLANLNSQKQIAFWYCPFQRFQDILIPSNYFRYQILSGRSSLDSKSECVFLEL